MITETPSLQKQVQPEGRFVNLIKQEFIKHAKEINRLEKDVDYKYYTKDEVDIAISEALADLMSTSADVIETLEDITETIDSKLDKGSPDYVKEVVVDGQNIVVTTGDNRTSISQLQVPTPDVPTKTSDLINDSGYISEVRWSNIINRPVLSPVATNGSYTDLYDLPVIPEKTSELVNDSGYITGVSWDEVTDKPTFATVATSGSYLDLSNTPTIPTKVSDLTNDTGYITGVSWNEVTGKPNFATVATSGSYTDLSNKPTIPTVPTNVSAFNNDSGYITGVAWNDITNKPSTFPPSTHNHNNQYPIINRSGMTSIASNTDLNTLTTAGTYYTTGGNTGSTIHKTLLNSPTNGEGGGFLMYVISTGVDGVYPKQIIYMYNGDVYERTHGASSWGEWHKRVYEDDIQSNYVDLTSKQTITGQKIFNQQIVVNRNVATKGTPPSSATYPLWIGGYEKGDGMDVKNRFGAVGTAVYATGNTETALYAYKNVANSTLSGKVGVFYPTNGDPYGFAPTPASTSNTNHIATTEWVNTKLDDYEVDLSNKPRTIEFIAGTQTAATPSFTGVSGDSALYNGKIIAYYLPFAGTSAGDTLELTLSDNTTTGAKPVWYRNQVTRLTTHYPANAIILMVYDATDDCWICGGQYNTTYSSMSATEATTGTATTARLITAKVLHDKIKAIVNQAMTKNNLTKI